MGAAVLIRTRSGPAMMHHFFSSEIDVAAAAAASFIGRTRSGSGNSNISSLRSIHLELKERKSDRSSSGLRRTQSDTTSVLGSVRREKSRPRRLERFAEEEVKDSVAGSVLGSSRSVVLSIGMSDRATAGTGVVEEEVEFSGGGAGKGRKVGGGGRGGGGGEESGMGAYYKEMLRADPENPLLLRNYGKFLHEVEGDLVGAEDCYGRAILSSPGDGEVLSLYGKLMWDAHKDEETAENYFQRAVEASPDDCYVLGSYAHFLWDAEDDEEKEEESSAANAVMVEAF